MNRRSNAMVAAACLAVVTAQATDFTYIGGDGDLSSSDVWGGSEVPGSADKAFITGSGNWAQTLSAPFAAGLGSIYPSKDGPLSVTINTGTSGWTGNGTTDP